MKKNKTDNTKKRILTEFAASLYNENITADDLIRHDVYDPEVLNFICCTSLKSKAKEPGYNLSSDSTAYPFHCFGYEWVSSEQLFTLGMWSKEGSEYAAIQQEVKKGFEQNADPSYDKKQAKKKIRNDFECFSHQWALFIIWQKCLYNEDFLQKLLSFPDTVVFVDTTSGSPFKRDIKNDKGVFSGLNTIGKCMSLCRRALKQGSAPDIDFQLLDTSNIFILGKRIDFLAAKKEMDIKLADLASINEYYADETDDVDIEDFVNDEDIDIICEPGQDRFFDGHIGREILDSIPCQNKPLTIISAMEQILRVAKNSMLEKEKLAPCRRELDYLCERFKMTDLQVILITLLADSGRGMCWGQLGDYLNLTRLSLMCSTEEIDELLYKRRWIVETNVDYDHEHWQGYKLVYGVLHALRHNKVFEPKKIENISEKEFIITIHRQIRQRIKMTYGYNKECDIALIKMLFECNTMQPIVQRLNPLNDWNAVLLFFIISQDWEEYSSLPFEGVDIDKEIENAFGEDFDYAEMVASLQDGSHPLITMNLIEHKDIGGLADVRKFVLTDKAKEELFSCITPMSEIYNNKRDMSNDIIHHENIKAKELFYNEDDEQQIAQVRNLLEPDNYNSIRARLEKIGMRKGIACLLSGGPGTGKTEFVKQLAKETKRDIMQVDISSVKDKFVGESEKAMKRIFDRYRESCEECDRNGTPHNILFINECDAIIGKRSTKAEYSVDKMNNTLQNILLEEMENLNGIMICTTNLTCLLDSAFERRFLYKIEFSKPSPEVRGKIWKAMMPQIDKETLDHLASTFELSGGQIENIARKSAINYVLNGSYPSAAMLEEYCTEEFIDKSKMDKKRRPVVGFRVA